jgi:hypothetical protein
MSFQWITAVGPPPEERGQALAQDAVAHVLQAIDLGQVRVRLLGTSSFESAAALSTPAAARVSASSIAGLARRLDTEVEKAGRLRREATTPSRPDSSVSTSLRSNGTASRG